MPDDETGAPAPLGAEELTAIVGRACMGAALEPIERGNNDGKIRYRDSTLVAVDCFGHEGNAEFLSHAQRDVLSLVDEVRRLTADLERATGERDDLLAREAVLVEAVQKRGICPLCDEFTYRHAFSCAIRSALAAGAPAAAAAGEGES